MSTIIRKKDLKEDAQYSYPVLQEYGIDSSVVDDIDPPFTVFLSHIPPGNKSQTHYHINSTQGQFYIKGHLRHFFGPPYDEKSVDIEAGDYFYLPRGIIHSGVNLSNTDTVEILCFYVGVKTRFASTKNDIKPSPNINTAFTGELKGERTMVATHIKGQDVRHTTSDDPPVDMETGVDASTVQNIDPPFNLFRSVVPAGGKTRARYYTNCACGTYIVKGNLRYIYYDPKFDEHIEDVEAGDYIYTPKGEIHCVLNPSETEPVEIVVILAGVTSREAAEKVYIEPPQG